MKNTKIIHAIIILSLIFGFGFLPPISGITPFGMHVLGGFLGCIYAYTVGIVMWPSFVTMFYLAFIQPNLTFNSVIATAFGNETLWIIVMSLLFCGGLNRCGLMTTMGKWLLSKNIVKKGPFYFLASIWLTSWFLGLITVAAVPVSIMMWSMYRELMEQTGIKKFSAFSNVVVCGIAVFAYLGASVFPFSGMVLMLKGFFVNSGFTSTLSDASYLLFSMSVSVVFFICAMLITKFVVRPKVDFDITNAQMGETQKLILTSAQKVALCTLVGLIVLLLLPSFIPSGNIFSTFLSKMGFPGMAALAALILSLTPKEPGSKEHIIELDTELRASFNWSQITLLATIFLFSSLLTAPSTGISQLLVTLTTPIFTGKSAFMTVFLLILAGCIITNCINNVVTMSILTPIALTYCGLAGVNPNLLYAGFAIILIQGCVLPSGSAVGALLHSNTDIIKAKSIYVYASIYTVLLAIVTAIVAWLLQGFFI